MKQDNQKKLGLEFSRLYFTAFFYSEYVLRHYEKNHSEIVECVTRVTTYIKKLYRCSEEEAIYYLDYIIEKLAYSFPEKFHCTISANSILKRNHDRLDSIKKIYKETHDEIIIPEKSRKHVTAYRHVLKDDCKEKLNFTNYGKIIDSLEECLFTNNNYYDDVYKILISSLEEGVYMSHVTSFRLNSYDFNLLGNLEIPDKGFFFKHIFYKKDDLVRDNLSFVSYKPLDNKKIKSDIYAQQEIDFDNIEYDEETECATDDDFDIDIDTQYDDFYNSILDMYAIQITVDIRQHHENFSIKSVLDSITSSILATLFPDVTVAIESFDVSFQPYIDKFFKESFYRTDTKELKHRLIGLLVWDLKNKHNIEKSDYQLYSEDYLKQYGVMLTPRDETNNCYDENNNPYCSKCTYDTCRKTIKNLVKITDESIEVKYIKKFSK